MKGAIPALAPAGKRLDDEADRRARPLRVLKIMDNVGVSFVQRAGCRVVAIALLGDRQRDDARSGIGHPAERRFRILRCAQQLDDAANHLQLLAFAVLDLQGVESVLRLKGVSRIRAPKRDAGDAPGGIARENRLGEDRLVRAMKGANP
ncbi:hypothetical protein ABIA18_001335 [Sinorhizobium fredii]